MLHFAEPGSSQKLARPDGCDAAGCAVPDLLAGASRAGAGAATR